MAVLKTAIFKEDHHESKLNVDDQELVLAVITRVKKLRYLKSYRLEGGTLKDNQSVSYILI